MDGVSRSTHFLTEMGLGNSITVWVVGKNAAVDRHAPLYMNGMSIARHPVVSTDLRREAEMRVRV